MNRLYFSIVIFFFASVALFAQTEGGVSIGKDGSPAHEKALLELVSQNKGLLIPRMSTDQRNAIFGGADESAKGLMVYDTSQNAFYFWDGKVWKSVSSANAGIVQGPPTGAGTLGELKFDAQNPKLYVYSGTAWVAASGSTGSAVTLNPEWLGNSLILGVQDGQTKKIDAGASNIVVIPKPTIGLASTNVQAALEELQGEISAGTPGTTLPTYTATDANKVLSVNGTGGLIWNTPEDDRVTTAGSGLTATNKTIALGGTLTNNTTIMQDNKDMTFNTGATGKMEVFGNFKIGGAVYANVRTHNSANNVTWGAGDYVVILTNPGINGNFALPNPGGANTGRILCVRNNTGGSVAPTNADGIAYPVNFNDIFGGVAAGSAVMFISDGGEWHVMAGR